MYEDLHNELEKIKNQLQILLQNKTEYPGIDNYIEVSVEYLDIASSNIGEV